MCEECRHHPCVYGCPNYEPEMFWDKCAGCGGDLYVGDTAYKIGDNYYCEDCCETVELENPERNEDFEYEYWRDRQLMDEWEEEQ